MKTAPRFYMTGKITAYSKAVNAGVIFGSDGKNYQFAESEWAGAHPPANESRVQFDTKGRHALHVKDQ